MKKTLLPGFVLLFVLIQLTSCKAQTSKLTKQIVETTIHNALYPESNNTDVSKTTLAFHSVDIARPRTLKTDEVYGIPGGTTIYPVLVNFTSINRTQIDPKAQPLIDTHDIVQKYLFYKDEFGKWVLDIVSSSENRDVEKRHWGDQNKTASVSN